MLKAAFNYAFNTIEYINDGVRAYDADPDRIKTDMGWERIEVDSDERAKNIRDLAEGERRKFICCGRKGNRYD